MSGERVIQPERSPHTLSIEDEGVPLVSFDMATGDMLFGEHYTPEGAAKVFWDAMATDLSRRIVWVERGKCWLCGQDNP